MKITTTVKEAMIDKATQGIMSKLSLDDFNGIFYELNLHHSKTKLFPYRVFRDDDLFNRIQENKDSNELDKSFLNYLNLITVNVVSPFDRGRKLVKVLKGIQSSFGDILPYNLCSQSALVVILYLFRDSDEILDDIKFHVMHSKIYYLKKYILFLLYIDRLKLKDNTDAIIVEFLKRDTFSILDIDIGVIEDVK